MRQWERQGQRVAAINLTMPIDAIEILRKYAPTPRGHGDFLSRLLFEYEARQDERQRIQEQIRAGVTASGVSA
jgi:hypothetical protein